MDLTEEIGQVASRAEDQVEHIRNEESTKHALLIPFISAVRPVRSGRGGAGVYC